MYDADYIMDVYVELEDIHHHNILPDISLEARDRVFPAHKSLLCAASSYFRKMFESGMKESITQVINLDSFDSDLINRLIAYIYTGTINLDMNTVKSYLEVSHFFQLDGLRNSCEKLMVKNMTTSNCISLYCLAQTFEVPNLAVLALEKMLTHLASLLSEREFLEYDVCGLKKFLANDKLKVEKEDCVVDAAMAWIGHNASERCIHLETILESCIRLSYCSPDVFLHIQQKFPFVTESKKCQEVLNSFSKKCGIMISPVEKPRFSYGEISAMVLCENEYNFLYSTNTKDWCSFPIDREKYPSEYVGLTSICSIPQGILVIGGTVHAQFEVETDSCYLLHFQSKTWKDMPSLNIARAHHTAVVYDGSAHVFGGCTFPEDEMYYVGGPKTTLDSTERLSFAEGKWITGKPMPKTLQYPMCVSFHSSLYLFGGKGVEYSKSSFLFDQTWNQWIEKAEMPQICPAGGVAVLSDKIYMAGGDIPVCQCYTPQIDTWTVLQSPDILVGRKHCAVVTWNDTLLVVGGRDAHSRDFKNDVLEYNEQEDTWSTSMMKLSPTAFKPAKLVIAKIPLSLILSPMQLIQEEQ